MTRLFVYGTLLSGEERGGLVAHLPRRSATVRGRLWRVPAGYPALELSEDGQPIQGELLELNDEGILRALDLVEGTNEGLYDRVVVTAQSARGQEQAWVYVMRPPQLRQAGCLPTKITDWRQLSARR